MTTMRNVNNRVTLHDRKKILLLLLFISLHVLSRTLRLLLSKESQVRSSHKSAAESEVAEIYFYALAVGAAR